MHSDLGTKILKGVSRSFYLSLRFLPKNFREPASVGYLLARLSDTIADAGGLAPSIREELLLKFKESLFSGECAWLKELDQLTGVSKGEQALIARAGDCLNAMIHLPPWQQHAVRKVVGIITVGQKWDITRFQGEGVVQLEDDLELIEYTYRVAGCVGEFWTELGFGLDDNFARDSHEQMDEWGRSYGRSLQLINILRDVSEDWEMGRCYLPGGHSMVERKRWIKVAREGLADAEKYCASLNGKRMRFATLLPALIGKETLDLLEKMSEKEWGKRVKVSRSDVQRLMGVAIRRALWPEFRGPPQMSRSKRRQY